MWKFFRQLLFYVLTNEPNRQSEHRDMQHYQYNGFAVAYQNASEQIDNR